MQYTKRLAEFVLNTKYEDIDIVGLGHTHTGGMGLMPLRGKTRVAVQASTYKILDSYGSSLGFDASTIFMPVVILNPFTKDYILATTLEAGAEILKEKNAGKK